MGGLVPSRDAGESTRPGLACRTEASIVESLPTGFVWGVSTSSFQIEGAAHEGGRGASVWDTYCEEGRVANRETAEVACDHYHRYLEDVGLIRQLGVQAYRFSIAWPRILPLGRGAPNEAGLDFYDRLIDAILAADIEPWLCLYHWDLPQALDDLGGWTNRDCAGWFADYAALVAARYGSRVKRFATFNEPSIFTLFGLGFGGRRATADSVTLHAAIHHINLAHGAAVRALRAHVTGASIGAIHNYQPCLPLSPADLDATAVCDAYWNRAYPDPQCLGCYPEGMRTAIEPHLQAQDLSNIAAPLDWFGINHYSPVFVKTDPTAMLGFTSGQAPPGVPLTPNGWPIMPACFRDALERAANRYRLPIYVMENGFGGFDELDENAQVTDVKRIDYLRAYIAAMNAAAHAAADVRGYFVWSLLDNFEWDAGYGVRFGLAYVDYPTQRRIPKASFHWYRNLINLARKRSA